MHIFVNYVAFVSTFVLVSGCMGLVPTETPIPSIGSIRVDSPKETLVIMLPGRGDRANTFFEHGFDKESMQLGFDMLAVDAHLGYYLERSLLPRLQEDIILPARAAGYRNIWLLGISMGGLGSLLYVAQYPNEIDGIILLAPYLGDPKLAGEVDASGGLDAWSRAGTGFKEYEIEVWTWLQNATTSRHGTPVILGYGESDRNVKTISVLAAALNSSAVYTTEGGHEWITWGPLWKEIAADLETGDAWGVRRSPDTVPMSQDPWLGAQ